MPYTRAGQGREMSRLVPAASSTAYSAAVLQEAE